MIKGLYVHLPFCTGICSYCDFVKMKYSSALADQYLDALEKEIAAIEQSRFFSIYLGGGTPTALSEAQLKRLFGMLTRFEVETEYTIEINPESMTLEKAKLMKQYGINRVSIGVQSFNETILRGMLRKHTNADVRMTLQYLDAVGIQNRSIDLIYGFAEQGLNDLIQDLQKAVSLNITHISIYDLEVYEKTILGRRHYQKIDDETDYLMYQTLREFLNEHSYKQYETSNFALEGYASRHNQVYWRYEDFLGVGAGAASKVQDERWENTSDILGYIRGRNVQTRTRLSLEDQRFEALMMNLRLLEGICIEDYDARFCCSLLEHYHQPIEKNLQKGLLKIADGYLAVTEKGIDVLNDILIDFMP